MTWGGFGWWPLTLPFLFLFFFSCHRLGLCGLALLAIWEFLFNYYHLHHVLRPFHFLDIRGLGEEAWMISKALNEAKSRIFVFAFSSRRVR